METAVAVPGIHVDMSSKRASATAVFQRCRSVSVDRPKTLKPANGSGAETGAVLKKPMAHEEAASNQNKPPAPAGKGVYGKRRQSFGTASDHKHLFKRRRRDLFTPPTKFLLGGNINDPLNLASFADDEVNKRANAVTPKSSPVPTPRHRTQVEVLIPPNINDPLNLNTGEDIEFKLVSPGARKRKRRHKRKSRSEDDPAVDASAATSTATAEDASTAPTTSSTGATAPEPGDLEGASSATDSTKSTVPPSSSVTPPTASRKTSSGNNAAATAASTSSSTPSATAAASGTPAGDKIVSPVVPQGSPVKFSRRKSAGESRRSINAARSAASKQVHFRPKDAHFQYGNYNRYYGYRNGGGQEDPRLKAMKAEWFRGRDVLDIGCNVGHLTLSLARDFEPRKVIGLDIDGGLIRAARRNVRHYLTAALAGEMRFPVSMAICHGPIAAAVLPGRQAESVTFPNNVFFVEGNYIVENKAQLEAQQEEFDMILCLSLTKWVHLNWGDEGVRLLFKRMYRQLRPGGRMLLEAQPFHSYTKKKKLTETTYKNFHAISLRPEKFNEYLLSPEVGFATCELVDTPSHASKGFQRPLYLFTKAGSLDESRAQARNNSSRNDSTNCVQSGAAKESGNNSSRKDSTSCVQCGAAKESGNNSSCKDSTSCVQSGAAEESGNDSSRSDSTSCVQSDAVKKSRNNSSRNDSKSCVQSGAAKESGNNSSCKDSTSCVQSGAAEESGNDSSRSDSTSCVQSDAVKKSRNNSSRNDSKSCVQSGAAKESGNNSSRNDSKSCVQSGAAEESGNNSSRSDSTSCVQSGAAKESGNSKSCVQSGAAEEPGNGSSRSDSTSCVQSDAAEESGNNSSRNDSKSCVQSRAAKKSARKMQK